MCHAELGDGASKLKLLACKLMKWLMLVSD